MMTNLFSMFDPSNFMMNTFKFIPFSILVAPLMIMLSKFDISINMMNKSLKMEFHSISSSNLNNNFILPLFSSIMLLNISSLIPSSFISNSQMSMVFPMTFSLWMMSLIFFIITKTNKFLSHLVPSGSPSPLMPIMVVIELISNLIRPITLSVRLTANITAGHLLMHLLSEFSYSSMFSAFLVFLIPVSFILNILELGVSFIQSYILCTLITLYSSEIK